MSQKKLEAHFAAKDPVMAGIVSAVGKYGLARREPRSVFETLARSIANQQISGVVAQRILARLEALHGGRFPTPAELAAHPAQALRDVGFSFSKVAALQDLATKTLDGTLPPDEQISRLDDESVIERCVAVRGIGRWTAEMLLMFSLGRPDVLPVGDFGVCNGFRLAYGLKGMPKPKALLEFGERWRPHRSAAAWYLWRAVDLHREGRLPKRPGRAPRVAIVVSKPKDGGGA
ncbi:MAG: DNA-3-methyladenine glycosylase [Pseudomonadota bacterium]|jgi:DNA-3-methyladenine glycosylase II